MKTFIILAVNTTLAQNYYNENTKNSQRYFLLRIVCTLFVLKKQRVFKLHILINLSFVFTSFSNKQE